MLDGSLVPTALSVCAFAAAFGTAENGLGLGPISIDALASALAFEGESHLLAEVHVKMLRYVCRHATALRLQQLDPAKGEIVGLDVAILLQQIPSEGCITPTSCLLYTSPSPRDKRQSRMPSSA